MPEAKFSTSKAVLDLWIASVSKNWILTLSFLHKQGNGSKVCKKNRQMTIYCIEELWFSLNLHRITIELVYQHHICIWINIYIYTMYKFSSTTTTRTEDKMISQKWNSFHFFSFSIPTLLKLFCQIWGHIFSVYILGDVIFKYNIMK